MPSQVSISIEARDNASPTLDKVRQQLEMFPTFARNVGAIGPEVDKASRSFADFDVSASKATRAVRGLAVPLISELSPALGGTASAMGQVVSSALLLGRGFSVVGIAAATAAGVLGGALLTAWKQNREAIDQMHAALGSGNLERVTAVMVTQRTELEKQNVVLRERIELLNKIDPRRAAQLIGPLSPAARVESAELERARIAGDIRRTAEIQEAFRGRGETEGEQGVAAITEQAERAAQAARRQLRRRADIGIDPIEAQYQHRRREISDLAIDTGLDPGVRAQLEAQARAERDEAARIRNIRLRYADQPTYDEGLGYGDPNAPGFLATQRDISQRIADEEASRRLARRFEAEPPPGYDEGLGYGDVNDPRFLNQQAEISARIITGELEKQLSITQSIATLNAAATDLSIEQREALSLAAIEEERILKLKLAQNDAQKLAVEVEAQLKRQRVLEATDPVAGAKRGIANIEVEFGSAGLRMQSLMQNIGGGMAGALDDTFFSVVTGKFQDLPDVARRFGADMVRAFTGELAKMATAAVLGQFRSTLDSLFPGGASGTSPFGAGSGGGPAGYNAGASVGPLLTESGRPLSNAEISAAYEAAGEPGVRALRSGDAAVIGGQYVQAGTGAEQVSAGAGLGATSAASGFTLRQGLGIAGSAALLGLTAYGATGARTGFDVGLSAGAGALAGYGLGAQLGGLVDASGVGGGIGAVAGAAIAGTIAALAKVEADKQAKKERQAAELERAAGAGGDLVRSAAGATSVTDLFRRITAAGSGYTGGTANPAVSTSVATPRGQLPIGIENPYYQVATLQDLLANPQSLQANIQAGVSPESLAGPNAATSTALQAIATDLVDQFREAEMGVGLTQEDRVGGLTRRTTYPASRADMLDPMRNVEIDELALAALSDDDRAVLLLDVMGRVAVEQDIQSTISDGATGAIVSITRIARSTIPLPPEAAPGVPAEARDALAQVTALNIPKFQEAYPKGEAQYNAPLYDYVQTGEGGYYVQQPGNTGPITGYAAPSAEQVAAYNAQKAEFYRPYLEQLSASAQQQLAALTPAEINAALAAGILTPQAVASLIQAGALPQIASLLPPEVRAQIGELQTDAAGNVTVGLPAGIPGNAVDFAALPPGTFSEAGKQAVVAALAGLVPGGSLIGLSGNVTTLQGLMVGAASTVAKLAGASTLVGLGIQAALNFFLGAFNVLNLAIQGNLAAQSGYADALVGGQGPAPATADGLTFAQQLAYAAQGVPFVADPNSPTGYSIDPTFGYVDDSGVVQGYHTAGNPSGLPTNPNTTNFGEGEGNTSGGVPGGAASSTGLGEAGGER